MDLIKRSLLFLLVALAMTGCFYLLIVGMVQAGQGKPGTYLVKGDVTGLAYETNSAGDILGMDITLGNETINGCIVASRNCIPEYTNIGIPLQDANGIKLGDPITITCTAAAYSLDMYKVPLRVTCRVTR